MRILAACVLLVGCTDAADTPVTIAHISMTATCVTDGCNEAPYLYGGHCGYPIELIEPSTHEATLTTGLATEDIEGIVQLQYDLGYSPPHGLEHFDSILTRGRMADVSPGYDTTIIAAPVPLYRLTAAGDAVDIDGTKLSASTETTLQFTYAATGYDGSALTVVEEHVIDPPRAVYIEVDDPGITSACCSVGRPADLGLVVLALAGLRRRRARR
jgi:hypothetical protein